jgi:beta-phosphoglucomutase family hydrolase
MDLVERHVRVTEHNQRRPGKHPPQPVRAAAGRAAVVDHGGVDSGQVEDQTVGSAPRLDIGTVVVAPNRVHGRPGRELVENVGSAHIARVQDHVHAAQLLGHLLGARLPPVRRMGVGQDCDMHPTSVRAPTRVGHDAHMLGLPDSVSTCLFDLDGVLTDTASVHRKAWAQAFDEFLHKRGERMFSDQDYAEYVDGKPREDGIRDFLASRGITLPEGGPGDAAGSETVSGIGTRKNGLLLERIHADGVEVYDGSRCYLEAAREGGLRRVVVSSSKNTADVLHVTGLEALVEGRVDGVTLDEQHLPGKPAPDAFLAGAALAGVDPAHAAVFEDAISGVQAGHAGRFGYVVGVNRLDDAHGQALREQGADVVVHDLSELL